MILRPLMEKVFKKIDQNRRDEHMRKVYALRKEE